MRCEERFATLRLVFGQNLNSVDGCIIHYRRLSEAASATSMESVVHDSFRRESK